MSQQKLVMVIEAARCIDCKGCMAACKVANNVPEGSWRNWIKSHDEETLIASGKPQRFQPGNCMQCDEPTCIKACPTGATYKDNTDGTVRINRALCIGCGQCLPACPYGARYRRTDLKVADKCDFCQARRAAGLEPACVETCPTKARTFGDMNDPKSEVSHLLGSGKAMQVTNAKTPTKPAIYYLGDPGPADWPVEAKMPDAFMFWKHLAGPAVKAVVGLTGLGVVAMLGKQLFLDDPPPHDGHIQKKGKGGSHEQDH